MKISDSKIGVVGVGKLGLCYALSLEENGYHIVAFDKNKKYIECLKNKKLQSDEPSVTKKLGLSRSIQFTSDFKKLDSCEIILIFVNTPSCKDGSYDHSNINDVMASMSCLNEKTFRHVVICSTVMPGFCDDLNKKANNKNISFYYSPEFIAQGSIFDDLKNQNIIIGSTDREVPDVIKKLLLSVTRSKKGCHVLELAEAEIAKIAINSFLTTKITFANFIGDLTREYAGDPQKVLNAVTSDVRINPCYMKPGFGFGGPCFPRDNKALAVASKIKNLKPVLPVAIDEANDLHLQYQFDSILNKNDKTQVLEFQSVAYKEGTNIIERSQKLELALKLADNNFKVKVFDNRQTINKIKSEHPDSKLQFCYTD